MRAGVAPSLAASFDASEAAAHLGARDARLARLIAQVGPFSLRLASTRSTFEALAESIVYQQLTGKAAATIHGRLCALFPRDRLKPEGVLAATDDALRSVGLSRSKVLAIRDLATRTLEGSVPSVRELQGMSDDAIVEKLVQIRGVGQWTAEMLLIFRLGRPDVLPVHDYGVRHGFKLAYRKKSLPTPKELGKHGERWRPFRTAASWYLWRAVDLERQKRAHLPKTT